MIDNPQKAALLLASLRQAVPFTVTLVPTLTSYLRAQHVAIAERTEHIVSCPSATFIGSAKSRATMSTPPPAG